MVRMTNQIFKWFIPWLLRVVWFTLRFMGSYITAVGRGVPGVVGKITDRTLDLAVEAGFPTQLDRPFFFAAYAAAFLTILAGWILTSFLTVMLVRWIVRM